MRIKKVLSAIAFVAIAMVSGGLVSIYEMNKGVLEVKSAAQSEIADTVQPEDEKAIQSKNEQTAQTESERVVQAEEMTFSCDISGCTQTEIHQHGLCGIDGCIQIGAHRHGVCGIAGCTETGIHVHNGEYCYPHSAEDGHA